MAIDINTSADWQKLVDQKLGLVVDPLILRCGEVFLNGAANSWGPADEFDLLDKNLYGIGMFFDALILQDKIPVFDYLETFPGGPNFGATTLAAINQYEEVLYEVRVGGGEYRKTKDAALNELGKLYDANQPKIPAKDAFSAISELPVAGYKWTPTLDQLDYKVNSEPERQLARYLLGGMIFGGYAQQMGTEHLMQPKRSRLMAALSVGEHNTRRVNEDVIFAKLRQYANTPVEDVPWTPTFFPYLLGKINSRADLLPAVVELRNTPEVRDYRQWMTELLTDLRQNGHVANAKTKDIVKIQKAIERNLTANWAIPSVELKVTVKEAGLSANLTKLVEAGWGWFLEQLPGNRYRSLLTRTIMADKEYVDLSQRVKTVWNS